jgi:hypothetical protein
MAFAALLNTLDLKYLAEQLTRPELDTTDTLNAAKIWDGGMRLWQSAPQPPYDMLFGDPEMKILKWSTTNMSSAELVAAMRRIALVNNVAKYPATLTLADSVYMDALADQINNTKIEPYNE